MEARGRAACLGDLTRAFYERAHESFSATRQSAWHGWDELWDCVGPSLDERVARTRGLRVADVACGNLRFVRFLQQKMKAPFEVYAFDGCEPLLVEGLRAISGEQQERPIVHEKVCDIVAALAEGCDFMEAVEPCELVVTFGFMHHVALPEQRERLLRTMAEHTTEDGFLAASFWQFADDARLREKAEAATQRAREAGKVDALGPNDYVLGWQDDGEAFRFCHHFTEDEINALSESLAGVATEATRFSADGKSGGLNRYVIWRRHG